MRYCILGHPRSGTGYMARLFQTVGRDVGHEKLGIDGIASWQWAVATDVVPWGEPRGARESLAAYEVIHVMRDPVAAVSSVACTEAPSEAWRRRWIHIPVGSPIERAIWSLLQWNLLVRSQRVDHTTSLDGAPELVARLTGEEPDHEAAFASRNQRPHPELAEHEIVSGISAAGLEAWARLKQLYEEVA